jgi:putative Mn2+ efflux pump MntP
VSFASIFALALGVAMDATAIAAGKGCSVRRLRARDFVLVSALFGGFQAAMPLLGVALGQKYGHLVSAWDHWIAFTLLAVLGPKMLWEGREHESPEPGEAPGQDPFAVRGLVVLAFATSIDAFAVGITLPMLDAPLLASLVTIGVVTAVTSGLGLYAGHRFGRLLGPRLDRLGGLILIALGVVILVQHLSADG